jgi:hypothetical protein
MNVNISSRKVAVILTGFSETLILLATVSKNAQESNEKKKPAYFEPICSLKTEGGQTDMIKPIFVSINFANADKNICTQPP